MKNKVILLKAPNDDKGVDPYQEELEKAGFNVSLIPVIQFNLVRTSELLEKLKLPSYYAGMVFTSKRTVEAVKNACPDLQVIDSWNGLQMFVVGQATSEAVKVNTL